MIMNISEAINNIKKVFENRMDYKVHVLNESTNENYTVIALVADLNLVFDYCGDIDHTEIKRYDVVNFIDWTNNYLKLYAKEKYDGDLVRAFVCYQRWNPYFDKKDIDLDKVAKIACTDKDNQNKENAPYDFTGPKYEKKFLDWIITTNKFEVERSVDPQIQYKGHLIEYTFEYGGESLYFESPITIEEFEKKYYNK